uniref:Uncharacterized protein n=1 Tax=Schistocephalus solidus TaxID=70667 RepID=A0A0X3PJK0_SCHSO
MLSPSRLVMRYLQWLTRYPNLVGLTDILYELGLCSQALDDIPYADSDSTVSEPSTYEWPNCRTPVVIRTPSSQSIPTANCKDQAVVDCREQCPTDQEISFKSDTSDWKSNTNSTTIPYIMDASQQDDEISGTTDAEQRFSCTCQPSGDELHTLEGNLNTCWNTENLTDKEDGECELDSGSYDRCSSTSPTLSSVLARALNSPNTYTGLSTRSICGSFPPTTPSLRSRRLARAKSPQLASSTPQGRSSPLPSPRAQFTPSASRSSPQPRTVAVTRSSCSPPPPPPPPTPTLLSPPSTPPTETQQAWIASSPPLPSPPTPSQLDFRQSKPLSHSPTEPSPSPSESPVSLLLVPLNTPMPPSPTPPHSPPPPPPNSPPPPLYASDYLHITSKDSYTEILASDIPSKGCGDLALNSLALTSHVGCAGRTRANWTQTTPVVDSGDRSALTQSTSSGMCFRN